MGLAGSGSVVGKMNAHIRLRLPDRAQAQHLLGCVCARLCEQLEPKALTTHYTADKPACVRKVSQKPWLLPPRLGCCRFAFLLNTAQPRVTRCETTRLMYSSGFSFMYFWWPISYNNIFPNIWTSHQCKFSISTFACCHFSATFLQSFTLIYLETRILFLLTDHFGFIARLMNVIRAHLCC